MQPIVVDIFRDLQTRSEVRKYISLHNVKYTLFSTYRDYALNNAVTPYQALTNLIVDNVLPFSKITKLIKDEIERHLLYPNDASKHIEFKLIGESLRTVYHRFIEECSGHCDMFNDIDFYESDAHFMMRFGLPKKVAGKCYRWLQKQNVVLPVSKAEAQAHFLSFIKLGVKKTNVQKDRQAVEKQYHSKVKFMGYLVRDLLKSAEIRLHFGINSKRSLPKQSESDSLSVSAPPSKRRKTN